MRWRDPNVRCAVCGEMMDTRALHNTCAACRRRNKKHGPVKLEQCRLFLHDRIERYRLRAAAKLPLFHD